MTLTAFWRPTWLTANFVLTVCCAISQIAKFMGPTWGPPGSCRPQMGPMLAPWTLLSGYLLMIEFHLFNCSLLSFKVANIWKHFRPTNLTHWGRVLHTCFIYLACGICVTKPPCCLQVFLISLEDHFSFFLGGGGTIVEPMVHFTVSLHAKSKYNGLTFPCFFINSTFSLRITTAQLLWHAQNWVLICNLC